MADRVAKTKEDILIDIEEKLKQEKWTRATIESYSVKNLIELDSFITMAMDEGFKEDLKALCKEHLKHSQNSIVGLYIIGVLSLEESSIDDTHLPQLIKLFMDSKKYKIAEFLSEKILSYRENKFALKTLETVYEEQNEEDELFNIKKRLVLIDSKDAANAKFLGEYYEKEGDKDLSMFYNRLAIERYIKSKSTKMVEELWNRIIKLNPDDFHLVINIARKIREVMGDERVADMVYNDVIRHFIKDDKYENALTMLKVILDFKPSDKALRKALEECYRSIYKDHSQLEKYLKNSALGQSWKPHREAIRNFESHIAFDKGSFVSHKNWGIGVVNDIQNDLVIIDFDKKKGHEMSLSIALRALNVLPHNHIIIWKQTRMEDLKEMIKKEPLKTMEIVLWSYGGEATSKDIKMELVPEAMDEKEWNHFWPIVRKEIEHNNQIVMSLTKRNVFELRNTEETVAEELIRKFKKTTNFENKVKVFIDYIIRGADLNDPAAQALIAYFLEIINASSELNERKLISLCVLKYGNYSDYNDALVDTSVIFGIKNLNELYESLDIELKKPFLVILQKKLKDWDNRFVEFILSSSITKLHNYLFKELVNYEKWEIINSVLLSVLNSYQEKPELFIWFVKIVLEKQEPTMEEHIMIKEIDIVYRLLSLIDILNNEIDSKTNVGRNKKIIGSIDEILFEKKTLDNLIDEGDAASANSILSLIYAINTLDAELKSHYTGKIIGKYPNLEESGGQEKIRIRHPFLVTRKSFENKKLNLERIMNVDIPQNSMAIGEAMEKGDLRENAEYKAALEKQDQLKASASKLEKELLDAKVLEKSMIDLSIVDVGTKVKLKNLDGKNEEYQILGQWEVNFENGIISYHSPLGRSLMDKKVGAEIDFEFNGEMKKYKILEINLADFD